MALIYTLGGQDISPYIQQTTVTLDSKLAQGAGVFGGSSGRNAQLEFDIELGHVATAIGAAAPNPSPNLVRQGEIVVADSVSGVRSFGGYVTNMNDLGAYKRNTNHLIALDYWASLDTIMVNEVVTTYYDVDLINYLIGKYAPWIDTAGLPPNSTLFTRKNYRQKTLRYCLQNIADSAGMDIYVDYYKTLKYYPPSSADTAPFTLSDTPNMSLSYPYNIEAYELDETAIVNRVFFYGGKRLSNDFTQDLSQQVNGTNTLFIIGYYPEKAKDGKVHLYKNGVELVMGRETGDQNNLDNVLKSKGGNADALLNSDAKVIQFDVAPTGGDTVTIVYRYYAPLVMVITAQDSYNFYGRWFDGTIADDTVFDTQVAAQRCRLLLTEQKFGLLNFQVRIRRGGVMAGQTISVTHSVRGISGTFRVQEVSLVPLGNEMYDYVLSLGAYNWNMVDLLTHVAKAAALQDDTTDETTTTIFLPTIPAQTIHVAFSTQQFTGTPGAYCADTVALGTSTDAYCGLCSI